MNRLISIDELQRLTLLEVLAESVHLEPLELDNILRRFQQLLNERGLPPVDGCGKPMEGIV